jgi:hypothetical protein
MANPHPAIRNRPNYTTQRLAKVMIQQEEKRSNLLSQNYFSVKEVAQICHLNHITILRWLSAGLVKGWRRPPKGAWRISQDEVNRLLTDGPRVAVADQETA